MRTTMRRMLMVIVIIIMRIRMIEEFNQGEKEEG